MSNIKLSICIPTYNFGEFIGEAIESIVEQIGNEVEIVVGDGASTDNTEEIINRYQLRFPNIKYHKFEKKGGIDLDLIKTIRLAKGDYCWMLSSDDVLRPGSIKRILDEIELGYSIYLCNRTKCDRNLKEISSQYWLSNEDKDCIFDFSDNTVLLRYLKSAQSLGALFSYMSSIIVRRAEWDNMSSSEILIGSNYAHVYKLFSLAKNGGKVMYIRDSLVATRLFNDSFMANGIARRYLIDLYGYQNLANHLFLENSIRDAFKSVLRREHKWYCLVGLASKVTVKEWNELVIMFSSFGYHPAVLSLVASLGRLKRLMAFVRYFRNLL